VPEGTAERRGEYADRVILGDGESAGDSRRVRRLPRRRGGSRRSEEKARAAESRTSPLPAPVVEAQPEPDVPEGTEWSP